jgi:hypothetical protein
MTISSRPVTRARRDAILACGIFALVLALLLAAYQAELLRQLLGTYHRLWDNAGPVAGLALGLVLLTIFNVAFWRHLRRAYASPRRRWRGDR